VEIDLDDVRKMDEELAFFMQSNTRRYTKVWNAIRTDSAAPRSFSQAAPVASAVHSSLSASFTHTHTHTPSLQLLSDAIEKSLPEPDGPFHETDVLDVLLEQRMKVQRDVAEEAAAENPADNIPPELKRRFEVRIVEGSGKFGSLRTVMAQHIGRLVKIRAMVARASDVKPLAQVITYTCEECGYEAYQEVTGRNFMPLDKCKGPKCVQFNNNAKLLMQTRGSKFVKFQEVKIQELPDQVPTGHIPRMMTVHLTGELTRACGPGDEVLLSGIYLPTPYTGYKAIKAGLTADTFLEATSVRRAKERYQDFHISPEQRAQIEECATEPGTYAKLAASIAPEIFGHEDVKKALLLLLVGGVDRSLKDGMRIRGDMHICLMGDPGVAKSQLLKHVGRLAPRGVYTTGKGSSGVGLTASVTKDQFTGEMMLEGGALVLADQGICCIDEFDKMEDSDRTAIHEVMEQQTVSIAKAGITTSLNARTCVLAAANPAYGRYNLRRSPSENINLPQALLSRFDILFLLMDRVNEEADYNLAKHVCYVHQHKVAPEVDNDRIFDAGFLRAYVAKARGHNPHVPKALSEYITAAYISMRYAPAAHDDRPFSATRDHFPRRDSQRCSGATSAPPESRGRAPAPRAPNSPREASADPKPPACAAQVRRGAVGLSQLLFHDGAHPPLHPSPLAGARAPPLLPGGRVRRRRRGNPPHVRRRPPPAEAAFHKAALQSCFTKWLCTARRARDSPGAAQVRVEAVAVR